MRAKLMSDSAITIQRHFRRRRMLSAFLESAIKVQRMFRAALARGSERRKARRSNTGGPTRGVRRRQSNANMGRPPPPGFQEHQPKTKPRANPTMLVQVSENK